MGIFDIFNSDAADKAAAAKTAGYQQGQTQGAAALGQGRTALNTNYASALMPFAGLDKTSQASFDLAGDLTGARGAEGQARAGAAFQTDPGYQFRVDQALDAVKRGAAGTGLLASGNTLEALQDRASNIAGTEYGNWANRALQMAGMAPNIASGEAGIYTGLGNQLNANYGAEGDLAYRAQTGIGSAEADAALDRNRASGQFWNTLLGAGQLAVSAATGIPALGGGGPRPAARA